jgi:hypothetical protein
MSKTKKIKCALLSHLIILIDNDMVENEVHRVKAEE